MKTKLVALLLVLATLLTLLPMTAMAAPTCRHSNNSYEYLSNGDSTHDYVCKQCGNVKKDNETCTARGNSSTCQYCRGPVCNHNNKTSTPNGDNTHTTACACGKESSVGNCRYDNSGKCLTCKGSKPCDHTLTVHTPNGNNTHTSTCDCGEVSSEPVECSIGDDGICTVCEGACAHTNTTLKSNGIWNHSNYCDDCEMVISTNNHYYNFFTHQCNCGHIDPLFQMFCPHNHHHLVNNGSNHKVVCDHCQFVHYYEPHGYNDSGVCSCGAIKPACLHSRFDTVNNGANHNIVCYDCGIVIFAEAHSYNAYDMCICGAVNPNVVPEVIPEEPAPIYPDDAWQHLDELFTTFK